MEDEKGSGSSNKDPNTHHEATNNGGDPLSKSEKKSSLSRSSTSSSSSSSSSNPLDLDEKDGVDQPEWSMVSASPRSGTGPSPRLSPPIQTMDRTDTYDPNRIPSSVFNSANNTSSAMEWSVASNESLFSIHMGNSSFSREHALLTKSGELTTSTSNNDFAGNLPPQTLPTVHESATSTEDSNEEGDCETPKMGPKKGTGSGDLKKEKIAVPEAPRTSASPPRTFASPPRLSDDSSKSFAFPVLASEGSAKPVPETPNMTAQARPKSKPEPKPNPKPEPAPEPVPEPIPQPAGETPAARKKWFPCLSCCPFCC